MNTTFDTMDEAYPAIEVALRDQAANDCGNGAGQPSYTADFDVAGQPYAATLAVTYGTRSVSRPQADQHIDVDGEKTDLPGGTFTREFTFMAGAELKKADWWDAR